jgi:hypothetical protein
MFRKGQKLTIKEDNFFASHNAARTYGIEKEVHEWEASVDLAVNGPANIHIVLDYGVPFDMYWALLRAEGIKNAKSMSARKTNRLPLPRR